MVRISLLFVLVGAVALAACKKDEAAREDEAPTTAAGDEAAEPAAEPAAATAAKPAGDSDGPFASYDLDGIAAKLQGDWVVGGNSLGKHVAWHVEGDTVTQFDGEKEEKLGLEVVSPCTVAVKDEAAGSTTYGTFAFDGDTLYKGLGSAGGMFGDDAVACTGGKVYVLSGDACTAWQSRFGDWSSEPAECSLEGDTLTVAGTKLSRVGDAFVNQQMKDNVAERSDDFEAAKAALAAK